MSQAPLNFKTWMTLGRVSNLPTVWTNTLAAALLASSAGALAPPSSLEWLLLLAALSLLYLAGMLLNDLLDADWDQQHQNPRPITLGLVSRQQVRLATALLLMLAAAALLGLSRLIDQPHWLLGSATLLVACILGYNVLHKKYAHSVWLMGACRSALYLTAAASLAIPPGPIWLCAMLLGVYISGLTYLARQEHRNQLLSRLPLLLMLSPLVLAFYSNSVWFWPVMLLWLGWLGRSYWRHLAQPNQRQVRAFIGAGLAALPLFDALVLAVADQPLGSLACVLVFFLLPHFQRWVKPT
ncbi:MULTISPECIES: UbiA family prenyltransferase [unclassified Pseudomonas]|uniref:UbiA family prenyltransferase n=1 Tax=unclassified Pseudomonas TaxID=196821 RepID=UPI001198CC10|nr:MULTISPECIES: UbiA family prenyltransferase [unclassified Pseudomonas]TWC06592.1 4-hydroxybenzoate polyprenyltransferase [Pseudomonas sp. SJZ075]TWC11184.1 4-hydroxybenzoate polyprenyltransferase [Pseudomonas sp. SJZ074]TWC25938.1 4-hydroxybenzoate polyprenyltransferase [Pseudomonas sp. SJZ078]TWC29650.1 4-hydroxybenzoate polyprenyltransferase [Pseudomonas sp. SJZ085]TWC45081.1 4-hydroxybenzoate polyprenyltransferase [Pseudomonas sp. SJZ124]